MSFQRKPPRDRAPNDGATKDDAPRRYSSFKPKPRGETKTGFGAKQRPEAGRSGSSAVEPPKYQRHTPLVESAKSKPRSKFSRDVDARKTRKVLQALENARAEALANGADLSVWETEFMGSLETRIDTYGSAFRDPTKGALEDPISNMQRVKLKEIHAKATGEKKKTGFAKNKSAAKNRAKKNSAAPANDEDR